MTQVSGNAQSGHVFVVHGKLEHVAHDVAVVPTDVAFTVESPWDALLGGPGRMFRPDAWPTSFARSASHDNVWFIDVGDAPVIGAARLADRVAALLESIHAEGVRPGGGRPLARVAIPILGIGAGGLGGRRGDVIMQLLARLEETTARLAVDAVLVTPEASVYAAAQHLHRQSLAGTSAGSFADHAARLGSLVREGQLALFLGAGASVSAGLPTWTQLLEELADRADLDLSALRQLDVLDQAQLLEKRLPDLGRDVATIASAATRPSLAHALLAGLGCTEVVTTNYDQLYEQAVAATGRRVTKLPSEEQARTGNPWVLKLHGDIDEPRSIVLTRGHFVGYDAVARPAGSLLQSLLLTRHLLVVGASLNDDNVTRLVYEVDTFRKARGLAGRFGTFLDVDGITARAELWEDQFHWLTFDGDDVPHRARSLEIFLDTVAVHASSDSSWLLDERFAGLLKSDESRAIAEQARSLHQRLGSATAEWQPLTATLRCLGSSP